MAGRFGKHNLPVIRSQYFLYFGVLGIYLPYFNLYCYHIGLSGVQIGALSALRSLVMVVFSLLWSALADRFNLRRGIYTACSMFSAAVWIGYLTTTDFVAMLLITAGYALFYGPIIAFLEATTMDALADEKKTYGRVRAWGSISFIFIVIVLGRLIDDLPIRIILWLVLAGSVLQAVGSLAVPAVAVSPKGNFRAAARLLLNRRMFAFLFCGFLMLVSHGAYYGFFSIHLENMGYSRTFIGLTWALASVAEILVMLKSDWLFRRIALEKVLLISFAAAALRWLLLFAARHPALILATQALHALTYGTFHMASILYMDRLSPEKAKTLGQAANNAVQYGIGLMIGFLLNGFLYERTGSSALFAVSAAIAAAAGGMFWFSAVGKGWRPVEGANGSE
jgi:PPP family 3-phenylpropionic acid transporter